MTSASVSEFNSQRNKMPGDRADISAVGPYVLELYFDPMGMRPRTVIEVNERQDDGNYKKVTSVWFNPDNEDEDEEEFSERVFDDPESAARKAFDEMKNSTAEVESHL